MALVSCISVGGHCVLSMELLLQAVSGILIPLPICLLYLDVEFGGCISGFRLPLNPLAATMYDMFSSCIVYYLFLTSISVVFLISLTLIGSMNHNSRAPCCLLKSLFCWSGYIQWWHEWWLNESECEWTRCISLYTAQVTWRHLSFPAQLQPAAHWLPHQAEAVCAKTMTSRDLWILMS